MQRWFAPKPVRIATTLIGLLAWINLMLVPFFSFYLPRAIFGSLVDPLWFDPNGSAPSWVTLFGLILLGGVALGLLWVTGYRPLYRGPLLLSTTILILYVLLILGPLYGGGVDQSQEGPSYAPWWYLVPTAVPLLRNIYIFLLDFTTIGTLFATWYVLMPLGLVTLVLLRQLWPPLSVRERFGSISISVLAIIVPIMTWTLSHRFMEWFMD